MANDALTPGGMQDPDEMDRAQMSKLADLLAELSEIDPITADAPEWEQRSRLDLILDTDGKMSVHDHDDGTDADWGSISPDGTWSNETTGETHNAEHANRDVVDTPGRPVVVEQAAEESGTDVVPQSAGVVEHAPPASGPRARVVPHWATDRRVVLPWLGGRILDGAAAGAFHVVRSPWYTLRGVSTVAAGMFRWVMQPDDDEQHKADLKATKSMKARRAVRTERMHGRIRRTMVVSLPGCGVWMWVEFGQWGVLPAAVAAGSYLGAAVLGYRGMQAGKDSRERAVSVRRKVPALSSPFVLEALDVVDCGRVKRPSGEEIAPRVVSASPAKGGQSIVIDLAPGVTVADLVKKHEKFAGALGRPAECVVIEPRKKDSPNVFELFIAAKRLDEKGNPAWPWRDGKARSFFDGVPIGLDARGNLVVVPLFENNGLIGGAIGMGKTFTARLLLLGAALDPRVILLIHNLKGGPDYRGFAPIAHTLRSGGGLADIQALLDDLKWLQGEIGRRAEVLNGLPSEDIEDGKLTDKIANMPGMGPILFLVDESQRGFAHKKLGDEIKTRFEDIARTGRSVGVHIEQVTQGTKEGAIPSAILGQTTYRIGHGVTSISDANLILGSDAHGRTHRAVDIDTPGIAYAGMAGGDMTKTAICKVDLVEVDRIVTKAHELRRRAGTLSGMAAGEMPADGHDGGQAAFLADVLAVWPMDDDGRQRRNASSAELADLLIENDKEENYDGIKGPDVSRRMGDAGVKVSPQRLPGGVPSARGVKRIDVEKASKG